MIGSTQCDSVTKHCKYLWTVIKVWSWEGGGTIKISVVDRTVFVCICIYLSRTGNWHPSRKAGKCFEWEHVENLLGRWKAMPRWQEREDCIYPVEDVKLVGMPIELVHQPLSTFNESVWGDSNCEKRRIPRRVVTPFLKKENRTRHSTASTSKGERSAFRKQLATSSCKCVLGVWAWVLHHGSLQKTQKHIGRLVVWVGGPGCSRLMCKWSKLVCWLVKKPDWTDCPMRNTDGEPFF